MSGPIRSRIGPDKANLLRYLDEAQTHVDNRPADAAPAPQWTQWLQFLKNDKLRIDRAIGRIDTQIQRWTDFILKLEPEERDGEEGIYNEAAEGATGFLEVLNQGYEKIDLLTSNIEIAQTALTLLQPPPPVQQQNAQQNAPRANQGGRRNVQMQLPKANLPEFEGDSTQWPSFWDSFLSSIHNNAELSDIERFNYLLGCLRGDAKRLIQGYFVTEANYSLAITKLRERYGDDEKIKADLRNELQKLQPALKTMHSIRHTFDNMERILLQLDQMGEDTNQTLVLATIQNKMPKWILTELEKAKIDIAEKWDDEEEGEPFLWDAAKAREALSKIIRLHEKVNQICANQPDTSRFPRRRFEDKGTQRIDETEDARIFVTNQKEQTPGKNQTRNSNKTQSKNMILPDDMINTEQRNPNANHPNPESSPPFSQQSAQCNFNQRPTFGSNSCSSYNSTNSFKYGLPFNPSANSDNYNQAYPNNQNSTWRRAFTPLPCIFCNSEQHFSSYCTKYATADARQKRLALMHKCLHCFKNSNHQFCPAREKCKFCGGNHKHIVCYNFQPEVNRSENIRNHTASVPEQIEHAETHAIASPKDILLMTQQVEVTVNGRMPPEQGVKIFLDPGASRSFITEKLVKRLGIDIQRQGQPIKINAHGMFGHKTSFESHPVTVQLGIRPELNIYSSSTHSFRDFCLRTTSKITDKIAMPTFPDYQIRKIERQIGSKQLGISTELDDVDILIGLDYFWDLVVGKKKIGDGLFIIETLLGPVLCGGNSNMNLPTQHAEMHSAQIEDVFSYGIVDLPDQGFNELEKCYSLEGIGIMDPPMENDDEMAQLLFDKTIAKNGDRYQVRWPFRPNAPPLPTNKNLAIKRLQSNIIKLNSTKIPPNLLQICNQIFEDQLKDGIIEEVNEFQPTENLVHYLPHQVVYRPEKKKARVVMDASAHLKGHPSLNDVLYRGPMLLPKVASVLLRWRQDKIVVVCDIKSAFLMLELHPADRDTTRFLWLKNLDKPASADNLKTYRFCRVLFGAVSSPFLLCGTIEYHLKNSRIAQKYPELSEEIRQSIYMDNILILSPDEQIAKQKIVQTREIFHAAGMELREFMSNDERALSEITNEDKIIPSEKFLGLDWEVKKDLIHFKFPSPQCKNWTMRNVLQFVNSVFDPLGLINPATFQARTFFQSLWTKKQKWDVQLTDKEQVQWIKIINEWKGAILTIPRLVHANKTDSDIQIHVFTDASELGYGTAVFARQNTKFSTDSDLLFAKSRLRPINQIGNAKSSQFREWNFSAYSSALGQRHSSKKRWASNRHEPYFGPTVKLRCPGSVRKKNSPFSSKIDAEKSIATILNFDMSTHPKIQQI